MPKKYKELLHLRYKKGWSSGKLAGHFGLKDHTSILYHLKKLPRVKFVPEKIKRRRTMKIIEPTIVHPYIRPQKQDLTPKFPFNQARAKAYADYYRKEKEKNSLEAYLKTHGQR